MTFKVAKSFRQGWFAYVSCQQPNAEFRLDMFRLYAGEYVAYEKPAQAEAALRRGGPVRYRRHIAGAAGGRGDCGADRLDQVPEDKTDHRFNRRRGCRQRPPGNRAAPGQAGAGSLRTGVAAILRAVLTPAAEKAGGKLTSIAIAENGPGQVALDGAFAESGGKGSVCGSSWRWASRL